MARDLHIVATGIVCPVGLASEAAYTAIRAGVSAYEESTFVRSGRGFEPLLAAAVPLKPEPRSGQELPRLKRLAVLALEECLRGANVRPAQAALLMATRKSARAWSELDLLASVNEGLEESFSLESRVFPGGSASIADCMRMARELLESGRARMCIVGGVDSLLNGEDIARLERSHRLHVKGEGHGLVPGEAAAFVAVTLSSAASLAVVCGVGTGQEPEATTVVSDGHATGRGLVQAWTSALADAGCHEREVILRVSDLTGEHYGGMDGMIAVSRLFRTDRKGLPIWHPAECVGATFAAAGALGVAIAALALAHGLPVTGLVQCESSSDEGLRGSCLLRAPKKLPEKSVRAVKRPVLPLVVTQHAEDAAHLFNLRHGLARTPLYDLNSLAALDDRIDAHLAGLRAAGAYAFRECLAAAAPEWPGETAVVSCLAFDSGEPARLDEVLKLAGKDPANVRALVMGASFLSWSTLSAHVLALSAHREPVARELAVRIAGAHRQESLALFSPGTLHQHDPATRIAIMKVAAELGLSGMAADCADQMRVSDGDLRLWAAYACSLFGMRAAAAELRAHVEAEGAYAEQFVYVVSLFQGESQTDEWFESLENKPEHARRRVQLTGAMGHVRHVPWLIDMMAHPELARAAGLAFSIITGIDLEAHKLTVEAPVETGPSDDPEDEQVALDADEGLPWPDAALVAAYWDKERPRFQDNTRYFCGEPRNASTYTRVLKQGSQFHRWLAALAQKALHPNAPLFEVRARARVQAATLGVALDRTLD